MCVWVVVGINKAIVSGGGCFVMCGCVCVCFVMCVCVCGSVCNMWVCVCGYGL